MRSSIGTVLAVALLAAACGDDKKKEAGDQAGTGTGTAAQPVVAETELRPIGVEKPADFNYTYGKGARAYKPVAAAYKAKDWTAVRSAAEETVELDPLHLDAHRVLAVALAQQGEYEKSIEHLGVALAGDWTRWGGKVESDPELEPLMSSPLGASVKKLNAAYREEFVRRARAGLLLVARKGAFKAPVANPKKKGAPRMTSRAELFAYDKELGRFLRLTQTGFEVVAFLPSPSGDEIAYVTVKQVAIPADPKSSPPVLALSRVGVLAVASPEVQGAEAEVKNARTLAIEYLAGDELVATAYQAQGWWGYGAAVALSIDKASGKTRASKEPPAGGRRLLVRYEGVELDTPGDAEGIAADWNPDSQAAEEFVLDASKKRVQLPKGHAARRASLAWSPDRKKLAFATVSDPCAEKPADRAAALYMVDVESGKLKHVSKGATGFAPRFLDAATLAHEDDEGGIRLYDALAGREVGRLKSRGGMGVIGVGAQIGLLCTRESAPPPEAVSAPGGEGEGEGEEPEIMEGE